jgi:drug efflux transport system ATP-binding protein
MDEAEQCDRLMLLNDGFICALGTPENLRREVEREMGQVLEITCDNPFAIYEEARRVIPDLSFYGKNILMCTKDPESDGEKLNVLCRSKGYDCTHMRRRPVLFEDVFVHFIKKTEAVRA